MNTINRNSDRDYVDNLDINNSKIFPHFLYSVKFEPFRHIKSMEIEIKHPITIIAGSNRIGKSTILMAIACSHTDFYKRKPTDGNLVIHTWQRLMKFSKYDKQNEDWSYWIKYRTGQNKPETKRGQRLHISNKWNGIAKKESQIKNRQVLYIDVERIMPLRNKSVFNPSVASKSSLQIIPQQHAKEIIGYLSYILEEDISISKLALYKDKDFLVYKSLSSDYSSFNCASGEDTITRILMDAVEAKRNSLILIDEIEIGLHPKIQRRLVDVLYHLVREDNKQFIVTTHSPTIYSSFDAHSRIFIEKIPEGIYKSIYNISVNAAFTKMDSENYPLIDLFIEDDVANKIVNKALGEIQIEGKIINFDKLINIIEVGTKNEVYQIFKLSKKIYHNKKIKTGIGCILDGDARKEVNRNGKQLYPNEDELFFLFSNEAPEQFLVNNYNASLSLPNSSLSYHINKSSPHYLFQAMVDASYAISQEDAFNKCWSAFVQMPSGRIFVNELKDFLIKTCKKYSPDL